MAASEGGIDEMDEMEGSTDVTPRASINSVPLPFHEAGPAADDGGGCRELTKVRRAVRACPSGSDTSVFCIHSTTAN
jgi:hypothetical protein